MACAVAATPPSGGLYSPRRNAEDLALDVSRLMDGVRDEVTALMQDGVQKTASFCASLCAERIVAARRDMQRRWLEERRELERLYGVPVASQCSAGGSRAGYSPAVSQLGAQLQRDIGVVPPLAFQVRMPPAGYYQAEDPYAESVVGSVAGVVGSAAGVVGSAAGSLRTAPPPPLPPSNSHLHGGGGMTPPTPQRLTTMFNAAVSQIAPQVNGSGRMLHQSADSHQSETMVYDSTFIDAYDAVQSLEERTSMASRAMDLLDEALLAAADAHASSPLSGRSGGVAGRTTPGRTTPQARSSTSPSVHGQPLWNTPQLADTPPKGITPPQQGTSPDDDHAAQCRPEVVCQPNARVRKVEPNGNTENIPSELDAENCTGAEARQGSSPEDSGTATASAAAAWRCAPVPEQQRGERNGGRAVMRERSVASNTSGEVSIAAADLHGM